MTRLNETGSKQRDPSTQDFLTGKILIAMPNMGDPRFEKSVIFMCAHDEDHAMGLIVNKPIADVELGELLAQLAIEPVPVAANVPVFFGGPVQTRRGVVLHTRDYELSSTIALGDDIGITASRDVLVAIGGQGSKLAPPRRFLLAIGHAGWGAGQLEQEIAMNAWAHCEADETIIFDGAKKPSWKRALSKLGVNSAMFSPEWAQGRDQDTPLN